MNFRSLALLSALTLLAACSSDSEDPAVQNDTGNVVPDTGGGTGDAGIPDTTVPDVEVPDAEVPDNGSDAVEPDGGTPDVTPGDTGTEDTTPTDGGGGDDTTTEVCTVDTNFTGQVTIDDTAEPNGGAPRFTPYDATYDSGIAAVVTAALAANADPFNTTESFTITGATVLATSFYADGSPPTTANRNNFWIGDGNGVIEVELDFRATDLDQPEFPVRVGSKISFTTTLVENNFNSPRVRAATGWALADVDQEVYIWDVDRALVATDVNRLARLAGTLGPDPTTCGGSARCWNLVTEFGTYQLRSSSTFLEPGQCITYVGPLSVFDSQIQLNALNFDWVWSRR